MTEIIFVFWFWFGFFLCCTIVICCFSVIFWLLLYVDNAFPCLMYRSSCEIPNFQIINARFPLNLSFIAPGPLQNTTRSSLNIRANGHILKLWSFFPNIQHFIWIWYPVLKLVLTVGLYRQNTSCVREQKWWDLK